ncbi:MAG: hypothetical protein JNK65_02890, partial [Deltaproteobacteria bacterium]|nr:hypothetical protein [Deltaproteobacteria bacterium]
MIRAIAETLAVYGASTGLPRLRPSPKNSNPEIQELHHQMISAMSRLDNPGFLQAATAPLQLLIPSHDIYHASNEFEIWINRSRQSMLLELKAQGWRLGSGYPPTQQMLSEILRNKEDEKPILISMKAINGKALVLNGHHRIATLITLVADGILPKRTLDAIPVQMVFTVSPYAVLHE